MVKLFYCFIVLLTTLKISSAQNPVPAPEQSRMIVISGGTLHVGNGQVIENAVIAFANGKIVYAGGAKKDTVIRDEKGSQVIDSKGKHIYPGIIALNSTLGLTEIDAARATRDFNEVGDMNPNVRAAISYNTDSKIIPTVRSNGVLLAEATPQGGTISGTSSVMMLDGWNWEDAMYKEEAGIHINWPRMTISKGQNAEKEEMQRENISKQLENIRGFFSDAKAYSKQNPKEKNLRFEAMKDLFSGNKKLFVHCNYVKEIIAAVNFCRAFGIKMVLVGGMDSWRVVDLLKENNVSIVIVRTHAMPPREDEDIDLPYKLPYLLTKAGITVCITDGGSWAQRNVPFQAGTASAYGLSKEEALMCITLNPAKVLGIDSTTGTIETGKDATLFISSGDALDMKTNNVEFAFIRGKEIVPDDVQKQLYRKYLKKYGLN
ncbi:MAG TPA: amidohydrolase family protein [Bacteroidia bacterium]|nr:amidohydrolase family protein [Bacteroidia bacterium]